jgi:small multidrug resistance pump
MVVALPALAQMRLDFVYLLLAIVAEVIATSSLKAAQGLTRFWPSLLVIAGYGSAFWLLSLVVKTMPIGIAYAIWSGLGIVLVTLAGIVFYRQVPDFFACLGLALIIVGVMIIELFAESAGH